MEKISRKELYELIWAEPVSKVAKRFGLSDVGLKKICERANIATRKRLQAVREDLSPRQPPLPNVQPEAPILTEHAQTPPLGGV